MPFRSLRCSLLNAKANIVEHPLQFTRFENSNQIYFFTGQLKSFAIAQKYRVFSMDKTNDKAGYIVTFWFGLTA